MNSKGQWSQKSLATKTVNMAKKTSDETGIIYLDRLEIPDGDEQGLTGYYVSVESTNAKKGGEAYYNVIASGKLYLDADDGGNGWLLDGGKLNGKLATCGVNSESDAIVLDDNVSGSEEYSNFVGFGDELDYAGFTVEETGLYDFSLKTTGKAKLVVYSVTESKGKMKSKSLLTVTAKAAGEKHGSKKIELAAGTKYYVSVQATDAKKGAEVYYDVNATLAGQKPKSALSMPETALADAAAAQDGLFAAQTADVLADVAAPAALPQDDALLRQTAGLLA